MKIKSSILLCEMDTGTTNLYVNGVAIFVDNKQTCPVDKIANCHHTNETVMAELLKMVQILAKQIELSKPNDPA